MRVDFHRSFARDYKKIPQNLKDKFDERLQLFVSDPDHRSLRRHQLKGRLQCYWSINITGDYRVLYEEYSDHVLFVRIGTHSQLYGK